MNAKRWRIGSLVVLLGLVAVIPASTQELLGSSSDGDAAIDLPLLILVNRMELRPDQMEQIRDLLAGLLAEWAALEAHRSEFEQEMIAFGGTAEELDAVLETFRAETDERIEAARATAEDAIDRIKEILTLKQGEILADALPGLLGGLADRWSRADRTDLGRRAARIDGTRRLLGHGSTDSVSSLRDEMIERMEQRCTGRPAAVPGRVLDGIQRLLNVLERKLEAID